MIPLDQIPCNIPVISAIVEKIINGEKHILLQTRRKPGKAYHDTLEIPAGRIEKYENIFDALKREIKEETDLNLKSIYPKQDIISTGYHNDKCQCFQSFCCQQQLSGEGGLPRVGFCFVVQVEEGELSYQESETRNPHRISVSSLSELTKNNPEKFFTLQLPFLLYYLQNNHLIEWNN